MALLRDRLPSTVQNRLAYMSNQKVRDWVVNRQWSRGHDWSSAWVFSLLSGGQGYLRWNKTGRETQGVFDQNEKTHPP
jgi:hypothetical protein